MSVRWLPMSDSPTSEPESGFVRDCEESMHSACAGEPFYKKHEGKRYCVLHFPFTEKTADFKKALQRKLENKDFNFHGVCFPDELSISKLDFTAGADFRSATFSAAADFRSSHFSTEADFSFATFSAGADFRSATFSAEASFHCATFSGEPASFSSATFGAKADFRFATFETVAFFSDATFGAAADFSEATFSSQASFGRATFRGSADFSDATFSAAAYFLAAADFSWATFHASADFSDATFSWTAADFGDATFEDYVKFGGVENRSVFGGRSSLNLQFSRIGKPKQVSFRTLTLRPNWFVNVDPRKFDLTNVDWGWHTIKEEVKILQDNGVSSPHRVLAIACRHLAVNAEDNNRYEEASRFRYMAMDARRLKWVEKLQDGFFKVHWKALKKTSIRLIQSLRRDRRVRGRALIRLKRFVTLYWKDFNLLHWFYWLLSGYGERVLRASIVLLVLWVGVHPFCETKS